MVTAGTHEMRRKDPIRDMDEAVRLRAWIADHGSDGVTGVSIRQGWRGADVGIDFFGNVVIQLVGISYDDSDGKWVQRPADGETLRDALGWIARFADGIVATGGGVAVPEVQMWDPLVIEIECEGQDEAVRCEFASHPNAAGKFVNDLIRMFHMASPPSGNPVDVLSHVARFEYTAGDFVSGRRAIVTASRKVGETGHVLVQDSHKGDGPNVEDAYRQEVPLTDGEWESLLDAIAQAEVLDWDATYAREGVLDGIGQTLELAFDNGWRLLVTGRNRWDRRFLPIARELMRYGIEEEELLVSVSEMEAERSNMYKGDGEDALIPLQVDGPPLADEGEGHGGEVGGKAGAGDATSRESRHRDVEAEIQKLREKLAVSDTRVIVDGTSDSDFSDFKRVPQFIV